MKIRPATYPAPLSDGKESGSASDSPPPHCRRHEHTGDFRHGPPPTDRIEGVHRKCVEESARPSAENLSRAKDPTASRRTGGFRPDSRSVAPAPHAVVENLGSTSFAERNPNSDNTACRDDFGNTTASIPFVVSDTPIHPQGVRKTQALRREGSGVRGEGCRLSIGYAVPRLSFRLTIPQTKPSSSDRSKAWTPV